MEVNVAFAIEAVRGDGDDDEGPKGREVEFPPRDEAAGSRGRATQPGDTARRYTGETVGEMPRKSMIRTIRRTSSRERREQK